MGKMYNSKIFNYVDAFFQIVTRKLKAPLYPSNTKIQT